MKLQTKKDNKHYTLESFKTVILLIGPLFEMGNVIFLQGLQLIVM